MKTKSMKVKSSDEFYTPEYVVEVFKKYIPKGVRTILLPFDKEWSNFVKILSKDYDVTFSHKEDKDFFDYKEELSKYDLVISNPPFSIKTKILEELYTYDAKFMMLLPLTTLEGIQRGELFKSNNLSVIVINKRISFLDNGATPYFNSSIFTNLHDNKLFFEKIKKVS